MLVSEIHQIEDKYENEEGEVESKIYGLEEIPPYEPYTDDLNLLFEDYKQQYGTFVSYVYEKKIPVGWTFSKPLSECQYPICKTKKKWIESHTITWVILHKEKPKTDTIFFHMQIPERSIEKKITLVQ